VKLVCGWPQFNIALTNLGGRPQRGIGPASSASVPYSSSRAEIQLAVFEMIMLR
jgi:hypothetical protein